MSPARTVAAVTRLMKFNVILETLPTPKSTTGQSHPETHLLKTPLRAIGLLLILVRIASALQLQEKSPSVNINHHACCSYASCSGYLSGIMKPFHGCSVDPGSLKDSEASHCFGTLASKHLRSRFQRLSMRRFRLFVFPELREHQV